MSFGREEADIEEAFQRMRGYFNEARRPGAAVVPFPDGATGHGAGEAALKRKTPQKAATLRRRSRSLAVRYLGLLARFYLWRRGPLVVAIAGNRGKTVFKRTLTELLQRGHAVRANPRSYNTDIGLPLAVLGLEINPRDWKAVLATLGAATLRALLHRERLDMLVLELGARQPGDMAALLRVVRPDWAIVTNLAVEGDADVAEPATMQDEMARLCRMLPPGRLLVSADDELLSPVVEALAAEPLRFGAFRLRARGGGHDMSGQRGDYTIGPGPVGASALHAVQAAVLLGEALGLERETLRSFLRETTGVPASATAPAAEGAATSAGTPPGT
jgi:UDP-N-acetylmuramyl pentapeptide synthase